MTIVFWIVTIMLALGFAGSIIKLANEGFTLSDFLNFLLIGFILVVFYIILRDGQYILQK
jgi:hypothetical protein